MVKLNVAKNQYTQAFVIPSGETEPPKAEPVIQEESKDSGVSKPKPTQKTDKETTKNSRPKPSKDDSVSNVEFEDIGFPSISLQPTIETPLGVNTNEGSIPLPSIPSNSTGEKPSITVTEPSQGAPTNGISVIVHGDNASININSNNGVSQIDEDISESEKPHALPTIKDIKQANTLKDLAEIEKQYDEVLRYLNAKKVVLEVEDKL